MVLFCKYFLLFIFYSFLGWILEMVVCTVFDKKVVNRGFLIGPYCPIYGSGCLLILSLLHKYQDDPFTLFIMAILVCSLLEYFTSYIMEKLFKARWWDYSNSKFNINGRICLESLILFGVLGLLLFYVANPFFSNVIDKFNNNLLFVMSFILLLIFIVDCIISLKVISGFKNVVNSIKKDNTEEITFKVKEMLIKKNWLYKRLVSAFNFKASERLLKELGNKAKKTIEKSVKVTHKTIKAGAKVAHKTLTNGVNVTKNTLDKTKKKVKEKVSDLNEKKGN